MRLLLATDDLVRDGRSFEGFPLLLNDDCSSLEPAQSFLWQVLVERGTVASRLTWEHYGRWLYDYFEFLEQNDLDWRQVPGPYAGNVVSRYRQWSLDELGNSRRTVNLRTGLVVRFYAWAHEEGHISHSPIRYRGATRPSEHGLLDHAGPGAATVAAIKLREHKTLPQILTMDQVRACRQALTNDSHRLLFELMLQVGLRSCEARTFPLTCAYNPRVRADLVAEPQSSLLAVDLSPREMALKYAKPRSVHVPWILMEALNAYAMQRRSGLVNRAAIKDSTGALIMNANGHAYTKDGVVEVFKALEPRVGFRVRPHMLRHTYATYVLRALRKNKNFAGEPLLYVRDRLGHSDVQTTSIYLHLINQLEAAMVLAHEDYVDELFARAPLLSGD